VRTALRAGIVSKRPVGVWALAHITMSFGISLPLRCLTCAGVVMTPPTAPILQMKVYCRVKLPLFALAEATSARATIPVGSLIELLAHRPSDPPDRLNRVRWLQEDYFVSDAELQENCERIVRARAGGNHEMGISGCAWMRRVSRLSWTHTWTASANMGGS